MSDLVGPIINHTSVGVSRLAGPFAQDPQFVAFISAVLGKIDECEACLQSDDPAEQTLSMFTDLFGSVVQPDGSLAPRLRGVQLDRMGALIGASRIVPLSRPVLGLFGFEDQLYVLGFDDSPIGGGRFREEGETALLSTVLEDIDYWFILQATVLRNVFDGTIDGPRGMMPIIQALLSIGGTAPGFTVVSTNMRFQIILGAWPTSQQAALLQLPILPRPQGVLMEAIAPLYTYGGSVFGFDDSVITSLSPTVTSIGSFADAGAGYNGSPFLEQVF